MNTRDTDMNAKRLREVTGIRNPWGAPVYRIDSCVSTMLESRALEKAGKPSGTVIISDFQSGAYGRVKSRPWVSGAGENLLWTVFLRFPGFNNIPRCITLRAGLAAFEGIGGLFPALAGKMKIKWPNDIMLDGKKISGILTENDGGNVFTGVGINLFQRDFGAYKNATSIMNGLKGAAESSPPGDFEKTGLALLEKILSNLKAGLDIPNKEVTKRLNRILFLKDRDVVFTEGAADSRRTVRGKLTGLSANGGLLIIPRGETAAAEFITGELSVIPE